MMFPRSWSILLMAVACAAGGYVYGIYSYPRNLWPLTAMRTWRYGAEPRWAHDGTHDNKGRLVAYPGKTEVACPVQAADTAVVLAIGQSNAANYGAVRETTRHPAQVLNVFAGKCYVAASPLLGATGEGGEFLTMLGDKLVEDGVYRTVIVMDAAVVDASIARWQRDGDLNDDLLAALKTLPADYKVTHIVWHQGETDLRLKTSAKVYQASFRSLLASLRAAGVTAPAFIAVASVCGSWRENGNEVAAGQRGLVDDRTVLLGADTDALLGESDRARDGCHLSESGMRKTALSYAAAMEKAKSEPQAAPSRPKPP